MVIVSFEVTFFSFFFFLFSLTQHPLQHRSAVSKRLLALQHHESLIGILEQPDSFFARAFSSVENSHYLQIDTCIQPRDGTRPAHSRKLFLIRTDHVYAFRLVGWVDSVHDDVLGYQTALVYFHGRFEGRTRHAAGRRNGTSRGQDCYRRIVFPSEPCPGR